MPAGRPTVLTHELVREFVEVLDDVPFLKTAAACLNISDQTWYVWLKKGGAAAKKVERNAKRESKGIKVEPITNDELLYLEFFEAHKKAIADVERRHAKKIGGDPSWQSSAWFLERRYAERWSSDRAAIKQLQKELAEIKKLIYDKDSFGTDAE